MLRGWWERFTDGHRLAEFLPDAEGVIERRHSPVAGLLIVVVALVFAGVLAWSALTEVEQVVRAEGQIEPADRVKVINHPDGGRIAEVNVVEGQQVAAGAPLLSFDAEQAQTKLVELTGHWQIRSIETARLQAEVAGGDMVVEPEVAQARPELIAEQQALLTSRREAHQSRIQALAEATQQREKELQSVGAEIDRLRASHGLLKEQLDAIKGSGREGPVSAAARGRGGTAAERSRRRHPAGAGAARGRRGGAGRGRRAAIRCSSASSARACSRSWRRPGRSATN